MIHSNLLLAKFSKLGEKIQKLKGSKNSKLLSGTFIENFLTEPGLRISRGYADLGYEEFITQSGSKLLSLYTGKASNIPEGHEKFFFRIYDLDELLNLLNDLNEKQAEIILESRPKIKINNKFYTADTLLEAALDALIDLNLNFG